MRRTLLTAFPLLGEFWAARWAILATACVFGGAGAAYGFLADAQYRAQVTLLPVKTGGAQGLASQLGSLGGLAGLAGINLGDSDDVEPLAVLSSREFARGFIESENLTPILFSSKWDKKARAWKNPGDRQPDIRDAVEYFDKSVRKVGEDRKSGLVVLAVEWTDPVEAARWANLMAERINSQLRDRAISEASRRVDYLRGELRATDQVELRQSISRLLEAQMQNMMVARGNPEYAFRVVDIARVPKQRFSPKRTLVAVGAALVGLFLACAWILVVLGPPGPSRR